MASLLGLRKGAPPHIDVGRAVVLDGANAWLTFDAPTAGRVLAVEEGSEQRAAFTAPVTRGLQTVVLAMSELPGDSESVFRLLYDGEGREFTLTQPQQLRRPTCEPESPDGHWHYTVSSSGQGLLVRRTKPEQTVSVTRMGVSATGLTVAWESDATSQLVLLDPEGEEIGIIDAESVGGEAGVTVPVDLAIPVGEQAPALARTASGTFPLARARNDLVRPSGSVLLPAVTRADGSELQLRWSAEGRLRVHRKDAS